MEITVRYKTLHDEKNNETWFYESDNNGKTWHEVDREDEEREERMREKIAEILIPHLEDETTDYEDAIGIADKILALFKDSELKWYNAGWEDCQNSIRRIPNQPEGERMKTRTIGQCMDCKWCVQIPDDKGLCKHIDSLFQEPPLIYGCWFWDGRKE